MTDHPTPCVKEKQNPGDCELEALAKRFGSTESRLERRQTELPRDDSSLVIAVDHNACILCDRCVRGCDVIKENHVIGRMGKGYTARIAFDLDAPMAASSCVACGECCRRLPDRRPHSQARHRDQVLPGQRRLDRRPSRTTKSPRSARRSRVCRTPFCGRTSTRSSAACFARATSSAARARTARRPSSSRRARSNIFLRTPGRARRESAQLGILGRDRPIHQQDDNPPGRQRARLHPGRRPGCPAASAGRKPR